jgi:hypothetical protein
MIIWLAAQQQPAGCILIGKVKVLPFVSTIYGSLESTSNPFLCILSSSSTDCHVANLAQTENSKETKKPLIISINNLDPGCKYTVSFSVSESQESGGLRTLELFPAHHSVFEVALQGNCECVLELHLRKNR